MAISLWNVLNKVEIQSRKSFCLYYTHNQIVHGWSSLKSEKFYLCWFLSMKWKCSYWQFHCLKSNLSCARICSIIFIKQCMFLVVMKNTVHFFSMKTISKTYSNNNMIHFIIWSQTMSSSQNMSNRIKDIHFDLTSE